MQEFVKRLQSWHQAIPWQPCLALAAFAIACAPHAAEAQDGIAAMEADIAQVFNDGELLAYEAAANSYLHMLHQAADNPTGDDNAVLTHHLGYMSLIVPENSSVRRSLDALARGVGTLADSKELITWWNRQDPLPATLKNERLEEHLFRVYYAKRNYATTRDSLGLDDRDESMCGWDILFVRLPSSFVRPDSGWHPMKAHCHAMRFGSIGMFMMMPITCLFSSPVASRTSSVVQGT